MHSQRSEQSYSCQDIPLIEFTYDLREQQGFQEGWHSGSGFQALGIRCKCIGLTGASVQWKDKDP